MARKKKEQSGRFDCDKVEGERFYAANDNVFRYNWWEVFCFPYILCHRIWDCFITLCAGTNQCLVYWMGIQWLICKITKLTTPDPIVFPYFFYMFCQVILLTAFFIYLWLIMGNKYIIPYFKEYYKQLEGFEYEDENETATRMTFRKYCFRKSDIFSAPYDAGCINTQNAILQYVVVFMDLYFYSDNF